VPTFEDTGFHKHCHRVSFMSPIPFPNFFIIQEKLEFLNLKSADHLRGLVARVLGYRSGGPGSIPGTTRKKK
jgi:hypothetical protein